MRLTRLFMLTTGLLLTLVLAMLIRATLSDWRLLQSAEQGLHAMELTYDAMKVAEKASAERGPTIPVLNDTVPPDPVKREKLAKARAASDEAMDRALNQLSLQNDAYARTAPEKRLTRKPIDLMFAVIDTVLESVTTLSSQAELIYPDLSLTMVSARYAAELREYAGRLGSQFTAPLASQKPIGLEEQQEIPKLVGRIEQLRKLIALGTRLNTTDSRVHAAIDEMDKRYFAVGLPFISSLAEAGRTGQPYGVNSAEFVARYVPEMKSIVEFRDTTIQIARDGAAKKVEEARRRLWVNSAIGLTILLIEISVFLLIQRWVLKPLLQNTKTMVAISQGKLDAPPPSSKRTDEIGDMTRAVAALRDTSLSKRALESEREALINQLRVASNLDFLTNLPNRRAFTDKCALQWRDAKDANSHVSLILFDLDHFKIINDQYGHITGDAVLVHVAQVIRQQFDDTCILARYGGEEFVAVLFDYESHEAQAKAEQLRLAIAKRGLIAESGEPLQLTCSFGVTSGRIHEAGNIETLLKVADVALNEAKTAGRNRVIFKDLDSFNLVLPY
jgi:diguanylate cyclase (GGDEF)-like protein